jgi:hypothetical protein
MVNLSTNNRVLKNILDEMFNLNLKISKIYDVKKELKKFSASVVKKILIILIILTSFFLFHLNLISL